MAKPTKQYIADKALLVFNERGYGAVRLQHIADAAFVSVGHLAYHFANKDGLLIHLFEAMAAEKQQLLLEHKVLPLFEDLQHLWVALFEHQQRYRFLYSDALEVIRCHPEMGGRYAEQAAWQVLQYALMIQFNVARGALQVPVNRVEHLARLLQYHSDLGLPYQLLRTGKTEPRLFYKDAWFLLEPWFTQTGHLEFQQGPAREISDSAT